MARMRKDDKADDGADISAPDRQRLDKWLFFARFGKTRPVTARFVASGCVRVDGRRVNTPGYPLKLGDVLTLALPHGTCVVRVANLGLRRGPAPEARMLYDMVSEG